MDKKNKEFKFLKLVLQNKTPVVTTVNNNYYKLLLDLKSLTEYFDYGCEFKDGSCRIVRDEPGKKQDSLYKDGCCCGACKVRFGYLRNIFIEFLSEYAMAWNDETGFFTPGKGCELPRKLRSTTCLRMHCYSFSRNNSGMLQQKLLNILLDNN